MDRGSGVERLLRTVQGPEWEAELLNSSEKQICLQCASTHNVFAC